MSYSEKQTEKKTFSFFQATSRLFFVLRSVLEVFIVFFVFCFFQLHNGVLPELPDTKCPVCNKEYQSFERQVRHLFEMHQEYWQIFSGGRPLDVFIRQREIKHREKRYSCEICKKYYSHETGYLKHMATHPEMSNLKMTFWTCHVCQKVFTKLSFLERHMDMKADDAHRRALAEYKTTNKLHNGAAVLVPRASQGSASASATATATATSSHVPDQQVSTAENRILSTSMPVFPTANSIVTSAKPKSGSNDLGMELPLSENSSWKAMPQRQDFPNFNNTQPRNDSQVSFTPTCSVSSPPNVTHKKLPGSVSQSTITSPGLNTMTSIEKHNNVTSNSKDLNSCTERKKSPSKDGIDGTATTEQCNKGVLPAPQSFVPAASVNSQFFTNALTTRRPPDGVFPAVSTAYRPMTPLQQLALAGSSMIHGGSGLMPGFPITGAPSMTLTPPVSGGLVAARHHAQLPPLAEPVDEDDLVSTLQSVAEQVNQK